MVCPYCEFKSPKKVRDKPYSTYGTIRGERLQSGATLTTTFREGLTPRFVVPNQSVAILIQLMILRWAGKEDLVLLYKLRSACGFRLGLLAEPPCPR